VNTLKISAKSRYALAALVYMAQHSAANEPTTVLSLSENLGISKIYLEQVFSLLRRGDVVTSIKGAQGGYRLTREPSNISVYEIFSSIETSMFERTESTVASSNENIERAMFGVVFESLDVAVKSTLTAISLEDVVSKAAKNDHMYYL